MRIEYKFNRTELKIICEALEQATYNTNNNDLIENLIRLRENLVSVLDLENGLSEVEE
ncbi:MAG: hypothetical protein ACOCRX_12245 [Candidatus Woesearchaeota archaeon]